MTKKSANRLARDAALRELGPDGANWDAMKELAVVCREAIDQTRANMVELFKTPGVAQAVPEPAEVAIALRGLSSDLTTLAQELAAIADTHSHLSGSITDVDAHTALLTTATRYEGWDARFQTVVIPNILYLTEQVTAARVKIEKRLMAEEETLKAQDPAVVTDVPVKDVLADKPE